MQPEKLEIIRNPDGTFPEGVSGNPAGRPKGKTMKEYAREYYSFKTDDEKKAYIEWLDEKKPGFAWTMGEGSPKQDTDVTSGGQPIVVQLVKYSDVNDKPPISTP